MTESSTIPSRRPTAGREDHLREPAGEPDRRRDRQPPRADRRRARVDPDIQVLVFDERLPDFFFNHFDLTAAAEFPVPEAPMSCRLDGPGVSAFPGSVHHYRSIRGRTRGGGNELAPSPSTCVTPAGRTRSSASPRSVAACFPAVAAPSDCRDSWQGPGARSDPEQRRLRRRHGRSWGWVTRALPDAELDELRRTIAARLASFDRTSLASAKAMVNRASLPPDADLVPPTASSRTRLRSPASSPARMARRRSSARRESSPVPAGGVHRHRQPATLMPETALNGGAVRGRHRDLRGDPPVRPPGIGGAPEGRTKSENPGATMPYPQLP